MDGRSDSDIPAFSGTPQHIRARAISIVRKMGSQIKQALCGSMLISAFLTSPVLGLLV
jgi:hypothetical protein